jgi:hypothetical protein
MFAQDVLSEIDLTINQLILNAKEMNNKALFNITKEEVDSFQNKQELLIAQLIHMDNTYKRKICDLKIPNINSASHQISKKLKQFEDLNNEFIERASSKFNLIHFEECKKTKKIRTRKKHDKVKLNKNKVP